MHLKILKTDLKDIFGKYFSFISIPTPLFPKKHNKHKP